MYVKRIELKNFRNYTSQSAEFSPSLNLLCGDNAQGKTNLLEAVYLCATGYSPRATRDRQLILRDQDNGSVSLEVVRKDGVSTVEIFLSKSENKRIRINGLPILKMGELFGKLNAVFFSPDELRLVKETPEERRRFMDVDLSQMSKAYYYTLMRYNRALKQRNVLIKKTQPSALKEMLPVWDAQLAHEGARIVRQRKEFVKRLSSHAKEVHAFLTDGKEELSLSYAGTGADAETDAILEATLNEKLRENFEKDVSLGFTTTGPHRDDIRILANGTDMRLFGSQGQQRTCALSMKLAELEIFKETCGEFPILLLDDVLSELDLNRQKKLFAYIRNVQTILTCTHVDDELLYGGEKIFRIRGGQADAFYT